MIYQFKCTTPDCGMFDKIFDVEQWILDEHVANCPTCGKPARRVFASLSHHWKKADYTKDGKRILNPDLPHVPEGTKYTHGWTPKEKEDK